MTRGKGLTKQIISFDRGGLIGQKLDHLASLLRGQHVERITLCAALLAHGLPENTEAGGSADSDDRERPKPE